MWGSDSRSHMLGSDTSGSWGGGGVTLCTIGVPSVESIVSAGEAHPNNG